VNDVYLLTDGKTTKSVPAGSGPPEPGATLISGPSLGAPTSSGTPTPTPTPGATTDTSGISSSAFGAAVNTSGTGALTYRNISIPVWRNDASTSVTTVKSSGDQHGSANAAESALGADKNASANALEGMMTKLTPQMFSEKDAYNEFASIMMDPAKYKQVTDVMVQSGWINPGQIFDAGVLQSRWNEAVRYAVDLKQLKGVEMTPLEAIQMWGQNSGAATLANQNYVRDHLTGTRVQNDQTIDEKTPSETTLHDLLGRNPTDAELIAYNHGVQQTAAAHPLNREIQTHYVEGQPDSQTVTYTGGYDQHAAEVQAAQGASPEVAQNQAATTYYNALVNALRPAA
jgi:hypothetical protein